MNKHTMTDLYQMQSLPLSAKIRMTENRIRAWYDHFDGQVYVSFSGGKDSTVLVDIITKMGYKDIPLVFVDTGLEYPEIREFVKGYGDRVTWLRPKMNFKQVIEKYGYPFISKQIAHKIHFVKKNPESKFAKYFTDETKGSTYNCSKWAFMLDAPFDCSKRCCDIMKHNPAMAYHKKSGRVPMTAEMASESRTRREQWFVNGCNGFDLEIPKSTPMAFWTEQDVLWYLKENDIKIPSVYGDIVETDGQMTLLDDVKPVLKTTGLDRTGCMFCGFGIHIEKTETGRFEKMKLTHPKQYEWIMKPWDEGGLGYKDVIDWMNEHGNLKIRY